MKHIFAAAQLTKHRRFQRSFALSEDAKAVQADFHSVSLVAAKQQSPNWLHDLLTKHVWLSADRKGLRLSRYRSQLV